MDSKAKEKERARAKVKAKEKAEKVKQAVLIVDPPRTGAEIARCQDKVV